DPGHLAGPAGDALSCSRTDRGGQPRGPRGRWGDGPRRRGARNVPSISYVPTFSAATRARHGSGHGESGQPQRNVRSAGRAQPAHRQPVRGHRQEGAHRLRRAAPGDGRRSRALRGEIVAMVLAETPSAARDGADHVIVEWSALAIPTTVYDV